MELDQRIDRVMDNIFRKDFAWFRQLEDKLFLVYQPSAINQKSIKVNLWFL